MKRLFAAALVILAALGVAVTAKSGASSAAYSGGSGYGGGGGGGPGPGCSSSSPYLSVPGRLYGVAGSSTSDVWAVALQPAGSLIMHWDGNCWTVSPSHPAGYFKGVSAESPTDAWAVGGTSWWNPSQTLAEHWDGTSWTQVATPNQGGSAIFNAVAATSATNAWAVGMIGPGPGVVSAAEPLIEHWDGTAWSAQPFAVPIPGGTFTAVAATSADDAWAVGFTGDTGGRSGQTTLIEHWDGSNWTHVPSPDPAGSANDLYGVTAISPHDAWAVGVTVSSSGVNQSLTMHWNGSTWTVVPSANPTGDTALNAVTAASANDVWAVGMTNGSRYGCGPKCGTVAMHWDGSTWRVVPTVDPPSSYLNALLGVTAISGGDVWAVGTTDYASTLIEHWDGNTWRD